MQIMVPVTVLPTTPVVKQEGDTFTTTIFLDLINRKTWNILRNAPEVLEAAVLTGKFNIPGHNHAVTVTPLVRQERVYGDLIEGFYLELVITSDALLPEDLLREPDCGTIQLA